MMFFDALTLQANAFLFGDDMALSIPVDNSARIADDMLI